MGPFLTLEHLVSRDFSGRHRSQPDDRQPENERIRVTRRSRTRVFRVSRIGRRRYL